MTYTFFLEIIVETFHCVGSQHANVHTFREPRVVSNWIYLFTDKVGDFISDLKTQNELLSVGFIKFKHQAAIATPDVEYLGHWPVTLVCSRLVLITNRVLLWVYNDLVLVIVWFLCYCWWYCFGFYHLIYSSSKTCVYSENLISSHLIEEYWGLIFGSWLLKLYSSLNLSCWSFVCWQKF